MSAIHVCLIAWAWTELITKKYTLEEINEGYADLMDGKNIRGVVVHQH